MLWATYHGKRLVNGHGGFALPHWEELVSAAEARDPERLGAAIRTIYPVRYVVVHRDLGLGRTWGPIWDCRARAACRAWASRTVRARRGLSGDPDARDGRDRRRQFASDFVRRHPLAVYAIRLAGEDVNVQRRVEIRFNGRPSRRRASRAGARGPGAALPDGRPERADLPARVHRAGRAVADGGYRIGNTGRFSPVDLAVRSAGHDGGGGVSVRVNGLELTPLEGRGYWAAALDPADGHVLDARRFDTPGTTAESERLAAFIEEWPAGTIVVAAAMDGPESQLTPRVVGALGSIGGRADLRGTKGWSHVLVAPGGRSRAGRRGSRPQGNAHRHRRGTPARRHAGKLRAALTARRRADRPRLDGREAPPVGCGRMSAVGDIGSRTGGEWVVAALEAEGVRHVFGIPGVHNLGIYDALLRQDRITHILARHEQGAGFMADGYARHRAARRGVVMTGPGATNALTPLVEAHASSQPVLLVMSDVPKALVGREMGALHEVPNQIECFRPVSRWADALQHGAEIPGAVQGAFHLFRTGRPGPVALSIRPIS